MAGRGASIRAAEHWPRPRLWLLVAALALLGAGIAIGNRTAERAPEATRADEVSAAPAPAEADARPASPVPPSSETVDARTEAGAVFAALDSVTAFAGPVLLDAPALRSLIGALAAEDARAGLVAAGEQASAQAREVLGVDTVPAPRILLRATPVGYRVDAFTPEAATVAVWYVSILGSGATVEPRQTWRTEAVSLVWERDAWRVARFSGTAGPTPPLAAEVAPDSAAELFTTVPTFADVRDAGD